MIPNPFKWLGLELKRILTRILLDTERDKRAKKAAKAAKAAGEA